MSAGYKNDSQADAFARPMSLAPMPDPISAPSARSVFQSATEKMFSAQYRIGDLRVQEHASAQARAERPEAK